MNVSDVPDDEQLRLDALRRYALLDMAASEEATDDLVRIAATVCGTPMAFIAVLAERREWFLSRVGLESMELPRAHAWSSRVLAHPGLTVVEDARLDPILGANPMVSVSPGPCFFAGAPLRSPEGQLLGVLGVLDTRARELSAPAAESLRALARQVMAHLESRRARDTGPRPANAEAPLLADADAALKEREALFERAFENASVGHVLISPSGIVLRVNAVMCERLGRGERELVGRPAQAITWQGDQAWEALEAVQALVRGERSRVQFEPPCLRARGEVLPASMSLSLLRGAAGAPPHFLLQLEDVSATTVAMEATHQRAELLEAVHDAILETDFESRVLYWNHAAEQLYGWRAEEVLGRDSTQLLKTRFPGGLEAVADEFIRTGRWEGEIDQVDRAGRELVVSSRWSLRRDAEGRPRGALAVNRDVTARRQELEALARSEEGLAATLRSLAKGVIATDSEGRVTRMNPAAESLTGFALSEALGRPADEVFQLVDERGKAAREGLVRRALRTEAPVELEDRACLRTRSGRIVPVAASVGPMCDVAGRSTGWVVVFRDVTEARHAHDELLRQKQEFRRLIDTLPDAVLILRAGRVLYANATMAKLLRFTSPESMVGRCFWALGHPQEREVLEKAMDALLAGAGATEMRELRFLRHDGEEMLMEATPMTLESFEGGPALLLLGRDLSERRKMQERLVLADRMASVGTLAAGVAHEINNPLSFVIGNLAYLNEELRTLAEVVPSGRLAEPLVALAEANQGAERVRLIVRDLHTFSRADEAQNGQVDVRAALESCIVMTANVVRHRAQLVRDFRDVPTVLGNEARLCQVFVNLLVNAAHAIPEASSREVVHQIHVRTSQREEWVVVEVEDNGCGIALQHRGRIFDPFFTTKPVGQGTGLGLSICHGIVGAMGGRIEVESELGRGACFRILLPAYSGTEAPIPLPAPAEPPLRGRVLVLDDEAHVGALVRRLLGAELEVVTETSAQQALSRLARGERFDAMLCDVMMPEMGGEDVRAEVARLSPPLAGRILFMTGGAFSPRAQGFLDGLSEGFLTKPFELQQLRARLRSLVGARDGAETGSSVF